MLNKNETINLAIKSIEKELLSLNDFAENEGHSNIYVMQTIANRIGQLELELSNLQRELQI